VRMFPICIKILRFLSTNCNPSKRKWWWTVYYHYTTSPSFLTGWKCHAIRPVASWACRRTATGVIPLYYEPDANACLSKSWWRRTAFYPCPPLAGLDHSSNCCLIVANNRTWINYTL